MQKRTRVMLIAAAVLAAVGFVVALALWDAAHPLRYLRADRVVTAEVVTLASRLRAGRDLTAAETAELCRLLGGARSTEPVDTPGTVRVELMTMDFGRVEIEDLSGPGARAGIFLGSPEEKRVTLRSAPLAEFLARMGKTLTAEGAGNNNGLKPPMHAD